MTAGLAGQLMALALAASVPASAAGRIAIDHAPVSCVPYDRYARIAATGAPAAAVAAAQLQFRAGGDGGWYSVGMAAEGTTWSAFLPRPTRPLARLEYRIVMRSSDAGEAATPAFSVRVGGDAGCGSPAQSSPAVAAPLVVHVPVGAPLVPPVPSGFSPAGVVAVEERVRTPVWKKLAGAGVTVGIGAAAALGIGDAQPAVVDDFPEFDFAGTTPVPGNVLSLSRDQLSVFLLLRGRASIPFDFTWTFEMLGVGVPSACVFMGGTTSVRSALPATVTLTGLLNPLTTCGERFDVDRSRLRVLVGNRLVFQSFQAPLLFHFEP